MPAVTIANHKVTFRRRREHQVRWGKRVGRGVNEAHFVADRDPALCIDASRPIGTGCAEGEVLMAMPVPAGM